jgi:4-amino-4-deoxy-L-arabinose transferase-like glycosyltransferase
MRDFSHLFPHSTFAMTHSSFLKYGFLLLLSLPFFVALEDSSVWDANEAFYVQTPREMVERGDWLVPHFNGQPRLNKPPLSYWLVALFYKLFSISVIWERLVMALLSYGAVLAVFVIGKTLFEETVALLASGVFATTFRLLVLSRRLLIDILMLCCVVWAIACFLLWIRTEKKRYFLAACFLVGLGFLTKGPVALLPIFFLGAYLLLTGRLGRVQQAPWLTGSLLCFFLCSFWFLLLSTRVGWPVVVDFFLRENVGRFSSLDFGPLRGPFFFVPVFLADFFPWSFFFPLAVVYSARHSTDGQKRDWIVLLSLWIGTYFLFFSISHNKQEHYILPLYPAAALWVARYLQQFRPPAVVSVLVATLTVIFSLAFFFMGRVLFEAFGLWIPLLFVPLIIYGLLRRRFPLVIVGLSFFYATCFAQYLEPLEEYKPVRVFAQTIRRTTNHANQSDIQIGYYGLAAPSLAFYLDRPILELHHPEEAVRALQSSKTVYLIVRADQYQELVRETGQSLQIVEVRPKLYTTARILLEAFKGDQIDNLRSTWTRPVYLITNRRRG